MFAVWCRHVLVRLTKNNCIQLRHAVARNRKVQSTMLTLLTLTFAPLLHWNWTVMPDGWDQSVVEAQSSKSEVVEIMKHFIPDRLKIICWHYLSGCVELNMMNCAISHFFQNLQKRHAKVEEPSLHIDTPAVGGLGGGRLPLPCEPRLHRPNASFESHALR